MLLACSVSGMGGSPHNDLGPQESTKRKGLLGLFVRRDLSRDQACPSNFPLLVCAQVEKLNLSGEFIINIRNFLTMTNTTQENRRQYLSVVNILCGIANALMGHT